VGNPEVLEMEMEAAKSDCINMWNYSFLKEYRRELVQAYAFSGR